MPHNFDTLYALIEVYSSLGIESKSAVGVSTFFKDHLIFLKKKTLIVYLSCWSEPHPNAILLYNILYLPVDTLRMNINQSINFMVTDIMVNLIDIPDS